MKALLSISAVLICAWGFSSSCHQGYACYCGVKDTATIPRTNYNISANNLSSATSQCNAVQAQHPGDSCFVMIMKD